MNTEPETTESKPTGTTNKPIHKHWAAWLAAGLVIVLLAGGGYLWMQLQAAKESKQQLQKDKRQLQQKVEKLEKAAVPAGGAGAGAAEADEEVACDDTPTVAMKENIKAALDTKNTAVFATYTTDPVGYVLAASEYGGNVSAAEAATSLEYTHSATGPWDFNLPPATIATYDAGFYTNYFDANTYVGKAASGMVVSFDFNCDGKIKQIFVAADDDLLL